jgi:hypothetical protein
MKEKPLKVYVVKDYEMSIFNYFVITPEGDYMYFETIKKSKEFIEFYKTYTNKKLVQA